MLNLEHIVLRLSPLLLSDWAASGAILANIPSESEGICWPITHFKSPIETNLADKFPTIQRHRSTTKFLPKELCAALQVAVAYREAPKEVTQIARANLIRDTRATWGRDVTKMAVLNVHYCCLGIVKGSWRLGSETHSGVDHTTCKLACCTFLSTLNPWSRSLCSNKWGFRLLLK